MMLRDRTEFVQVMSKHVRPAVSEWFQERAVRCPPMTSAKLVLAGLLVVAIGASAATTHAPPWVLRGTYAPVIDPANFVRKVDNPYFPLAPGTAFHFRGSRDTTPQTDDEVVTHATQRVLGVRCIVVRDTVSERGKPVE